MLACHFFVFFFSSRRRHTRSLCDWSSDVCSSDLPGEILREVIVPIDDARTGTGYKKMVQPASGFAIVGVAARVRQNAGKVSFVRLGITGLSNHAYRATAAEKALEGKPATPNDIQNAAALVTQGVDANSDLHASADYRRHLPVVHAARARGTAISRIA